MCLYCCTCLHSGKYTKEMTFTSSDFRWNSNTRTQAHTWWRMGQIRDVRPLEMHTRWKILCVPNALRFWAIDLDFSTKRTQRVEKKKNLTAFLSTAAAAIEPLSIFPFFCSNDFGCCHQFRLITSGVRHACTEFARISQQLFAHICFAPNLPK